MDIDAYEVLQVHQKAELDVIRAAFRTLARKYHSDSGGTGARMASMNEAWAVLGNPESRAAHDAAPLAAARDLRLSVNDSPRQLSDVEFVGIVFGALEEAGLPPDALDLEVTESVVFDCREEGIERLRVLRAAAVGVSLDDFGTGYSSLGNLRTLPIDQLKVDRTFVAALLDGGIETAVVSTVIGLGRALGASVVAEGIEDVRVAARLAELGCPLGQGYFFGRPQPIEHLQDRYRDAPDRPAAIRPATRDQIVVPLRSLG